MKTVADDITHQQILNKIGISHKQLKQAIGISHKQLLEAMTQQLGVITDNMVTKKDLKEELKRFATKDEVREIVGEELKSSKTKKSFRGIVREETAGIRDEQLRQGVLLEDLNGDFKKLAESVSNELKLKQRLDNHDSRIATSESKGKIVISTVTHHSDQLKALQAAKS